VRRREWFIDEADNNKLKIHFADDMLVPAKRDYLH
jgi:hypothetical protein